MPRNALGPIPLALLLVAIVWVGSSSEGTSSLTMMLLAVILVGLVLYNYATFKANVQQAFAS